ncbi:MAG: S1 RNA-binding domain-containing protein [Candidatus Doudnabacteria bacterium]|nr:S1 RNA-binding domain-containing protein [Candidatus Doudnabacteria bacterium]
MNDLVSGKQVRLHILKEGEVIQGRILSVGKNEVYVDVAGVGLGVVRGRELYDDETILSSLKVGDMVYASVIEIENKDGNIELSFRKAGQERVWQALKEKLESREVIHAKILEANKGGLMVKINNVLGFLPVSQLAPSHYPRVEDGDKNRILAVLKGYVGQDFDVRIITAEPEGEKLIISERAVIEGELMQKIGKLAIGDVVEGVVTGVVDFGAFVKFGEELEGLVHISELAWQRIEDPKDIVKVGDRVKAQIISIDNDRISLSFKRLQKDPWEDAVKQYSIGQIVRGKVVKLAPFGAFVELDPNIHGLAHVGELSEEKIKEPGEVLKEGEEYQFKIISIEPQEHRLGLSLKGLNKPETKETSPEQTTA